MADMRSLIQEFDEAIDQLEAALLECPSELWGASLWEVKRTDAWIWPADNKPEPGRTDESIQIFSAIWVVAYHCLFYLDFYVTTDMTSFETPEYIRGGVEEDPINEFGTAKFPDVVYPPELLLRYLKYGRSRMRDVLPSLTDDDLGQRCGSHHPHAGKTLAELLQVNLAHIREHGGQIQAFLARRE